MRNLTLRLEHGALTGLESQGTGPAVVLCHGNSASASLFRPLLESELGRRHRMIALNFPGHAGSYSTQPGADAYSIPGFAKVLVAAVRALGLSECVLVGHSLGGHVMTTALQSLPQARALLLVSAPPLKPGALSDVFKEDPTAGAMFAGALEPDQVDRFAAALLEPAKLDAATVEQLCASIRTTDPAFRPALLASIGAALIQDEQAILASTEVPTALAYGTEDRFIQPSYYDRIELKAPWREGVIAFHGSGHCLHLDAPNEFRMLLTEFLAGTERGHGLERAG